MDPIAPRWQRAGMASTTGIDILTSGIWQTTSTIVSSGDARIVIDPAYFPRELAAIAERAGRDVDAVVFTHGHWDHVMGHAMFDAPVWLSSTLESAIATDDPRAAKYLEDAREFDSRWYVPREHGHHWPERRRGLADGECLDLGGTELRVTHVPGHSPDGIALAIDGTLLVGDYLSPCEIPFVDDAVAYRASLERLIELVRDAEIVIPGHGPQLIPEEALAIARADVTYLDGLLGAAAARSRDLALSLELPRATDVVGMRAHHLENLDAVGLG